MIHNTQFPPYRCLLYNPGLIPYITAHQWQRSLVTERIHNPELDDVLILLEHPPVYTLGTGANLEFLKFNLDKCNHDVHRIERGGEVTYHCPGQLVAYPILNLRRYRQDLHWYLRQLEEVLIRVLLHYDLPGERIAGFTGVWLEGYKVAAIGIKVSKWITMHGFSLNVCPDMTGFKHIVPCGIVDRPVCSLAAWIPGITCDEVSSVVSQCFSEVFNVKLVAAKSEKLWEMD
ncbi:lipoyl(octanoyl) transferase LipB [Dolichospermum sp. FACHB-1091]|uniref:lipoyl(octanoyl) transferase LipB n=1 Tax=Dolichospermum sp. FACHB-1091 TaxID=2692798 RepID=UPI001681BE92|nr:lipoyl(octanoyl) transferase LipB [Dolichospermum sp. FACHB-1091]MBD2444751.1 lipoyl(octanoyl) transferase LipB [Dolichospermum sp. FACHB-1091]